MQAKWDVEQASDGLRMTFDPIDLRARTRIPTEAVPLFFAPAVDSPLTVHRTAAGLDAHAATSGSIALTVARSSLNFGEWLASPGAEPS